MKFSEQTKKLIKNLIMLQNTHDFKIQPFSFFLLCLVLVGGYFLQMYFHPYTPFINFLYISAGSLAGMIMFSFSPTWWSGLKLIASGWIAVLILLDITYIPLLGTISLGILVSPCIQLDHQWEKAIVLRFGKFRRIKGPGIFWIFPLVERIAEFVDTRIRATDFSAETTLTRDTVPVNVDAIAFWMIWDPKKAILELENFMDAVILSAQTALRDAIGKHELASLLSERDQLGKEIQKILEGKTNAWGITILSIEIRDVIIPKGLEDAMSKRAQAERERQARVILGTAEVEISEKFEKAAERYKDNPTALHLRAMNMIYEGLRKNGSIVLLPSNALESMSLGTMMGTHQAMEQIKKVTEPEKGTKEENNG
ncbi:MAG: slipin family protein [Spirochaetales bacterium]|nr:slipin family protein [Spirochaetales bacterium]